MNRINKVNLVRRRVLFWVAFLLILIQGLPIKADEQQKKVVNSNKVLLVYDSKNTYYDGEKIIDSVQRLLTSLGMSTTTTTINKYQRGTLEAGGYKAVVTLINWKSGDFRNQAFSKDRQRFKGSKIHIGQNLETDESLGLRANVEKLVRQQLMFEHKGVLEELPYTDSMEILADIKGSYLTFGKLQLQGNGSIKSIPFGVINNNNAYLPFWKTTGLGLVYEQELLKKLLIKQQKDINYRPMLLVTKVTPFANLEYLKQLIQTLYRTGIHFVISATISTQNTNQKAFFDYVNLLKYAEEHNGLIYLRVPYLQKGYLTGAVTNKSLSSIILENLRVMYRNQIYPMGITAPNYWNHDKVLSNAGLKRADEVLLLSSPKVYPIIATSKTSAIYNHAYYVASLNSFEKIKATRSVLTNKDMKFKVPTALSVNLPRTYTKLKRIEKDISKIDLTWYDFSTDSNYKKMVIGNKLITYQYGNYFVNGQQKDILEKDNKQNSSHKKRQKRTFIQQINHAFSLGSRVLMIIVIISLAGLTIFLIKGRQVYIEKFKKRR